MPSRIYWTRQAREDLRAIRFHIARDAPATASAYIRKLRDSVARLNSFLMRVKSYLNSAGKNCEKSCKATIA